MEWENESTYMHRVRMRMELLQLKAAKRPQRNALKTPKKRESLAYFGIGSQEGRGRGRVAIDRPRHDGGGGGKNFWRKNVECCGGNYGSGKARIGSPICNHPRSNKVAHVWKAEIKDRKVPLQAVMKGTLSSNGNKERGQCSGRNKMMLIEKRVPRSRLLAGDKKVTGKGKKYIGCAHHLLATFLDDNSALSV